MDRLAKEGSLFRCFFGPPRSPSSELLSKLSWYDGTVEPYYYSSQKSKDVQQIQSHKNIMKYCTKVIENVVKNASNKHVCCLDFLMNDVKKSSPRQTLDIERAYNDNRVDGLMYCVYKTDNLLNSEMKHLVELLEIHEQIFVLNEGKAYKLHLTNVFQVKTYVNRAALSVRLIYVFVKSKSSIFFVTLSRNSNGDVIE